MGKMKIKLYSCIQKEEYLFCGKKFPKYEFHIASEIRKKFQFEDELFSSSGNVVFADFRSVRNFVHKFNSDKPDNKKVGVGLVNASALIDEIYHYIFRLYELQVNPKVFGKAYGFLDKNIGEADLRKHLFEFVQLFPPIDVYKGKSSIYDYLNGFTEDRANIEIILEELILLHFANLNPANKPILELFDENYFSDIKLYRKIITSLNKFFKNEKKFGPDNQDIFSFFKTPFLLNPDNIEAQLEFIKEKWGVYLSEAFLKKILLSKDLSKEDIIMMDGGGPAPTIVPKYKEEMGIDFLSLGKSGFKYASESAKDYDEPENFTQDTDWMPKVVLLAKNTYVWLDQLSKKYGRHIRRLDNIPDEELHNLASWGFNGLWLIGVWERSSSSKKIKNIMGNLDAVASAYSLYDYEIARDLGGEEAYDNLNYRAKKFGIRLASDMVPNHTGIFSKWVIEHPDYFIQTSYPPFPSYQFTGPDLSEDQSVQLRIEDGYWSRSDAAVVFQRIDNRTGDIRYIYHGNDGTHMPWNDTAQLNMLRRDVREAVIQKIFDVARKFSIIRFDAAMTLTKKHFARLWFPEPGTGGDIPSRTDYAMTRDEFDRLFSEEFWREVVDRINSDMPETLLLAEAFWLMEGYFVRTLGMHRVYNSAFMHMLMKEENDKYRDLITNTLEFEPEILKRYVNFMSNPDEETAIKQFGTEDKYFGVCVLMSTLPGLPMFAHGQIEGYTEKYGMEYQRAYYHEIPNQWLVDRHIREIFPLLKKRYLFSQVNNFWFFDFIDNYGRINENVFAYTNSSGDEKSFVLYNNKYESASGKIFRSTPKLLVMSSDKKEYRTKTFAEALNVKKEHKYYYIFREHISNLEYIKSGFEIAIEGMYLEIGSFKYVVYLDFREVYDEYGDIEKLARKLGGRGVPSITRALVEMQLEPIHNSFEKVFDDGVLQNFIKSCILNHETVECAEEQKDFIDKKYSELLETVNSHLELNQDILPALKDFKEEVLAVRKLNITLENFYQTPDKTWNRELQRIIITNKDNNYHDNSILFVMWLVISNLSRLFEETGDVNKTNYLYKILLDTPVKKILNRFGKGDYEVERANALLKILQEIDKDIVDLFTDLGTMETPSNESENIIVKNKKEVIKNLFNCEEVKFYCGLNSYENVVFYSKENFEELLSWLYSLSLIEKIKEFSKSNNKTKDIHLSICDLIDNSFIIYSEIKRMSDESGYRLEVFKEYIYNAYKI